MASTASPGDLVADDFSEASLPKAGGRSPSRTRSRVVVLRRAAHNASLGIGISAAPIAPAIIETFGPLVSVLEANADADSVPVVHSVDPKSALAGTLLPGDVIVAVGDAETTGLPISDVCDLLAAAPDGSRITIVRVGRARAAAAGVGRRFDFSDSPAPASSPPALPSQTLTTRIARGAAGVFGVDFEREAVREGIVVRAVSPAAPAGLAGVLRPGDIVAAIDGVRFAGKGVEAVAGMVQGKQSAEVEVIRRIADARAVHRGGVGPHATAKASAPPERAMRLRPSALELPSLAPSGRGACLSSTWGQRIAALRSLPAHLYLRDDPPPTRSGGSRVAPLAEPETEWWVPQAERGGGRSAARRVRATRRRPGARCDWRPPLPPRHLCSPRARGLAARPRRARLAPRV